MRMIQDFIELYSGNFPENKLFPKVLSILAEEGFFQVLETEDCLDFHTKLFQLAGLPHGVGLSVGIMAQVNMAGGILKLAQKNGSPFATELIQKVQAGEATVSFGASEKNWKGRLSHIQTKLESREGRFILNGEKSFLTNGANSDFFLILSKGEEEKYFLVAIPSSSPNTNLHPFQLSFAKEATHASVKFDNLEVKPEWIFQVNYQEIAERLRISEIFSLNYIFNGYIQSILPGIVKLAQEKEIWDSKSDCAEELFNLHLQLEMHKAYLERISRERYQNMLTYPIESRFPFGLQILIPSFLHALEPLFSKSDLILLYPDLELFFYQDDLGHFFLKKSVRNFIKHLVA